MSKYPKEYIDQCQSRVDAHVTAYKRLRSSTPNEAAAEAFEPVFFNNMILVLDAYFVHRARALELKDGNPLNEVRVMCNSMMYHDDVMTRDASIKLAPEHSVAGIRFGERIALREKEFSLISAAFVEEIRRKYL